MVQTAVSDIVSDTPGRRTTGGAWARFKIQLEPDVEVKGAQPAEWDQN